MGTQFTVAGAMLGCWILVCAGGPWLSGCDTQAERRPKATAPAHATASAERSAGRAMDPSWMSALGNPASRNDCAERRATALRLPGAPGAAAFESQRALLAGRIRGANVLWKREPRYEGPADGMGRALHRLETGPDALAEVRRMLRTYPKPEQRRSALLREGYLYVRGADAALAVIQQVSLTDLFTEPTVYLMRAGAVHELRRHQHRRGAEYVHVGGDLTGERAELLLADRVGLSPDGLTRMTLAIDFREARRLHGFDRIRVEHLTMESLVAQVRYGPGVWVPALFDVQGPVAKLVCHAPSAASVSKATAAYTAGLDRQRVQARVREVVEAQVREKLPFDAPRGEDDPRDRYPLRPRWRDAYAKGMTSFRFLGKRYPVYDTQGRPWVPQVCLELVYDTWERAAGTWYRSARCDGTTGQLFPEPERIVGTLNLDVFEIDDRRRVAKFLAYAEQHPEHFDLWKVPSADRVLYRETERFFQALVQQADQLREGDVLVVRRIRHGERALYHNMLVMETDPFLGIPTLLATNTAHPRLQTFDGVMQLSANRFLYCRVRPQPSWFDAAVLRSLGAQ
ncbi:MAG: hypothetical protein JW940_33820 [Polyangiaceae bacterium]|nr:hypothetical protein [Polyangiaceae bacterium]